MQCSRTQLRGSHGRNHPLPGKRVAAVTTELPGVTTLEARASLLVVCFGSMSQHTACAHHHAITSSTCARASAHAHVHLHASTCHPVRRLRFCVRTMLVETSYDTPLPPLACDDTYSHVGLAGMGPQIRFTSYLRERPGPRVSGRASCAVNVVHGSHE